MVQARHEAAREMGRRKAAASRKARARIAPLTASGTVQDITAVVRGRAPAPEVSRRDAETGELLEILGLADQLNKPIPSAAEEQVITLTFEARPTMRLVADRLLVALTGAPGSGTRFAMTDQLLNRLSDRRRLVVIGEAQNLNRDCFEYLRHLHDDPATRFALLFDGGDGCWEVLAREPMLRSRIYRRIAFRALSDADVLALIPGYHPIYAGADPELLVLINDKAANGRLRSWAAFTHTASVICRGLGAERIDKAITRNAIAQLGTAR